MQYAALQPVTPKSDLAQPVEDVTSTSHIDPVIVIRVSDDLQKAAIAM